MAEIRVVVIVFVLTLKTNSKRPSEVVGITSDRCLNVMREKLFSLELLGIVARVGTIRTAAARGELQMSKTVSTEAFESMNSWK